jgi:hypothetical protein
MTTPIERPRPLIIFLSTTIVILMGHITWQTVQLRSLRAELRYMERQSEENVSRLAAERLRGRREDIVRTSRWLHEFYASTEGLQRPDGLWISSEKHPDFEAIGAWVFDVYLNARINGASDADARQAVVDAIHATDEWRRVHKAR